MKHTIAEAKQLNTDSGRYFFSPDTMRFFNSRIESEIMQDCYFITSEFMEYPMPKKYTVRVINWENGDIRSASEFQQFKTLQDAKDWINEENDYANNEELNTL